MMYACKGEMRVEDTWEGYVGWYGKNRMRPRFKGRFVDSQHDKDISRPEGEKGWPLRIIKEKQQRKGNCRQKEGERVGCKGLAGGDYGILAKLFQRMSRAEKLIFSYVVLFKLLFYSSRFLPLFISLFIFYSLFTNAFDKNSSASYPAWKWIHSFDSFYLMYYASSNFTDSESPSGYFFFFHSYNCFMV